MKDIMKGPLLLAIVSSGGRHKTRVLEITQGKFKIMSLKCRLQVSFPEGYTSVFIPEALLKNGFWALVPIVLSIFSDM